jgi:hypothetical protein
MHSKVKVFNPAWGAAVYPGLLVSTAALLKQPVLLPLPVKLRSSFNRVSQKLDVAQRHVMRRGAAVRLSVFVVPLQVCP